MVYFQKSPLFIYWKGTHTNALQETKGMLMLEAKGEGGNHNDSQKNDSHNTHHLSSSLGSQRNESNMPIHVAASFFWFPNMVTS
jgi:hypothetical protein